MKFNLISIKLQLFLFCSSLIVAIILFYDSQLPLNKSFLPFLPLTFSFASLVFVNIFSYLYNSVAVSILVFTYYIRMTIVPFFMKFSFYQRTGIVADINSTFNTACLLMIYEFIVVFMIISIIGGKYCFLRESTEFNFHIDINNKKYRYSKKILLFVTILTALCIVLYPEILTHFKFFVFISEEQSINWYINNAIAREIVPSIIYYTSTWTLTIIKNIWVLVIVILLRSRGKSKLNLFLSIVIIILNSLISTGDTAYSLYFSIAFLIIMMYLYPNSKRIIMSTVVPLTLLIVSVGLYFISKISSNSSSNFLFNISNTLQAYFSGPINVAISLLIDDVNILSLMFSDFLRSLPLIKTFFQDMTITTEVFNQVAYGTNGVGGQIIPSVGLGKLYFGFFLAPIFSCLFTYYSIKYGYKSIRDDRLPYKFLYQFISINLACMPVLYNFFIFLIGLFTYIIPTWIFVIFLTKRIRFNNTKERISKGRNIIKTKNKIYNQSALYKL